jgi:hypothetical protein
MRGICGFGRACMLALAVGLILLGLASDRAKAIGTFISAPGRVDMVYDDARGILYITSGSSVLRYSLTSNTFFTPFSLTGNLGGIDISPDGNRLLVADRQRQGNQVSVLEIDLLTGMSERIYFPRAFGEGGTFTVAFGADGTALVSSTFEGSGWVPLRRYDPVTGSYSVLTEICQNTMLAVGVDRSVVGFAESNISDGRFGRYRVSDGHIIRMDWGNGTGWFNYEMGVNRNGTQYAIPTYGGTYLYNADLMGVATIGQYASGQPIGVVYHPTADIVYFAWATSNNVRAYDTNTYQWVGTYDFENHFDHPGNHAFGEGRLKISRTGAYLFATVQNGVRYVQLAPPPSVVSGRITLQNAINQAQIVTLEFRPTDGSPAFQRTTRLNPDRTYTLADIPRDAYNVWIKSAKFLAKALPVDTTNGNVSNVNATLLGGDANNDNSVDVLDLDELIRAFDTVPGDPSWNDGADFNSDEFVDILDLDLLIRNFDLVGDS